MRKFGDSSLGGQRSQWASRNRLRVTGLAMDAIDSLMGDRDGRVIR
jgi:hypothetical protein